MTESDLALIYKDAWHSYEYAEYVLKGRFELGEEAIATCKICSLWYARNVLCDRFELCESSMANDISYRSAYNYFMRELGIDFQI